jgi:hypothetical protein
MLPGFPAIYLLLHFIVMLGGVLLVVLFALALIPRICTMRILTRGHELKIDLPLIDKD